MNNLIVKHWQAQERKLPEMNCIVYPNGNMTLLNIYSIGSYDKGDYNEICKPLCDTTINSIEKYHNDYWTSVDEWVTIDYNGGKIHGGEAASNGCEGFIACVDKIDNLIWAMLFIGTNPIKSLKITGNILLATNEHSELQLVINLDVLTDIKMIAI